MKKRLIAVLLLALMLIGLCGCDTIEGVIEAKPEEKEFEKGDFSITLTDEFEKLRMSNYEGYLVGYETQDKSVRVLVRELGPGGNAENVIKLAASTHGGENAIKKGKGYQYFTYIENPDDQELYYYVAFYDGKSAAYEVTFITPMENINDLSEDIEKWAKSVDVD